MKISSIECFKVNIPFKRKFEISHQSRENSESVFVKVLLADGTVGWGECLPRDYVTGETQDSVVTELKTHYLPIVTKWDIKDYDELIKKLSGLDTKKSTNCALCAIEIGLLDAYGKYFKESVSKIFGSAKEKEVVYDGIVSAEKGIKLLLHLLKMRFFGMRKVKVKVGVGDDVKRLRWVTRIVGSLVPIRVDANCAWTVPQTLVMIEKFKGMNVTGVEQPVKTIQEINELTKKTTMPIIVDESLCTIDDAKSLNNVIFDIRISKCGGLLKSYEIYKYAQKNIAKCQISCQLGCQVGESGILSAAGRHFAFGVGEIEYLEGSYNHFLLKKDITKQDMTFGRKGEAKAILGYGIGVDVDEGVLRKFIIN